MWTVTVPPTPEMLAVAQRLVWFCSPQQALDQPYLFLAHVMTYGTVQDVVTVQRCLGREAFSEALAHAPPGVFDARSWSYWHLMSGRDSPPPLPQRQL